MSLALPLIGGCTSVRQTDPPRTATEQFLLSRAAGEAVRQLNADALRGRIVFVDSTYFAAAEQAFVLGELRAHLLLAGVRLAAKREEADAIVEVRSSGVGIDRYEFLLGLPSIPLSTAATMTSGVQVPFALPELALMKNTRQRGTAGVAFVAYWADNGEVITSSGPFIGRSRREDWWFFGAGPNSFGNIPTITPTEE